MRQAALAAHVRLRPRGGAGPGAAARRVRRAPRGSARRATALHLPAPSCRGSTASSSLQLGDDGSSVSLTPARHTAFFAASWRRSSRFRAGGRVSACRAAGGRLAARNDGIATAQLMFGGLDEKTALVEFGVDCDSDFNVRYEWLRAHDLNFLRDSNGFCICAARGSTSGRRVRLDLKLDGLASPATRLPPAEAAHHRPRRGPNVRPSLNPAQSLRHLPRLPLPRGLRTLWPALLIPATTLADGMPMLVSNSLSRPAGRRLSCRRTMATSALWPRWPTSAPKRLRARSPACLRTAMNGRRASSTGGQQPRGVGGGTAGQRAAGMLAAVGVEGSAAHPEGRLLVGDRELSPRHDGPASRRRARRRRSVGRWR